MKTRPALVPDLVTGRERVVDVVDLGERRTLAAPKLDGTHTYAWRLVRVRVAGEQRARWIEASRLEPRTLELWARMHSAAEVHA